MPVFAPAFPVSSRPPSPTPDSPLVKESEGVEALEVEVMGSGLTVGTDCTVTPSMELAALTDLRLVEITFDAALAASALLNKMVTVMMTDAPMISTFTSSTDAPHMLAKTPFMSSIFSVS